MATTLGGVTLAAPLYEHEGYVREFHDIGAEHEMADGSTVYDYVGTRYIFHLKWRGITSTEKDAIVTRALVKTTQAFSPPDYAGTYNVRVVNDSFTSSYIEDGGGTARFDCELSLETVDVV